MQKRWTRLFAYYLGVPLILGLLLAACGPDTGTQGTTSDIIVKISSDFPTSGADTTAGQPAQNGVDLAVQEANAAKTVPGVKFEFVPKNDVGPSGSHDPTTGQQNINALIGDYQVAGMVGPLNSSVAQAMLGNANTAGFPIISPANTNDCLTQEEPAAFCGGAKSKLPQYRPTGKVTYFRIAARDEFQGAALANFGFQEKGYKKVYIIDDTETYGAGLATSFETFWKKLGGEVVKHDSIQSKASYIGELTAAASLHPDLLFFGGNDSTGGTSIKQQLAQVPELKNLPMIAGDGFKTSGLARTVGANSGGPTFASVASIDVEHTDTAKDFLANFSAKYGANNISAYSAASYDCAKILIQAVKEVMAEGKVKPATDSSDSAGGKAFRDAVVAKIQTIKYDGVTGHQEFDKNGDSTNRVLTVYMIGDDVNKGDGWSFVKQIKVDNL